MNNKRWTLGCLLLTVFCMILGALPTVVVDPYFHYHKPLEKMTMILDNERYQNYGILRNFSYDAIITGTSMTENFKVSEFDALFDANAVKTSFSGGSYKEIGDSVSHAFRENSNIRFVIRGIDCNRIIEEKDSMNYDADMYPQYLYDRKFYNDVYYILNKYILLGDTKRMLSNSLAGMVSTTFDEYSNWEDEFTYGAESVLNNYTYLEKVATTWQVTEEEIIILRENMEQNFLLHAKQNPNTQFYYFFTPYSIVWWDGVYRSGETERYITLMKEASRMMVEYDNIHLFSFFDMEDLICNLDHYKDTLHYSGEINSQMLQWMKNEEHRLTKENYASHWDAMLEFYGSYHYDSLFE